MSKILRFTKTELANAAKVAKAHGVSVKLGTDGSIFVYPHADAGTEEPDEWDAWEEKNGYGRAEGAA